MVILGMAYWVYSPCLDFSKIRKKMFPHMLWLFPTRGTLFFTSGFHFVTNNFNVNMMSHMTLGNHPIPCCSILLHDIPSYSIISHEKSYSISIAYHRIPLDSIVQIALNHRKLPLNHHCIILIACGKHADHREVAQGSLMNVHSR